jgi:uncharacterized protein
MIVGALPLLWRLSIVLLAGVGAGIANGIAGGGTFITFPTLLGLGLPALRANITTTVGVVPSYFGSLRVFRTQLRPHRHLILTLLPSCVLGSGLGCYLLLAGSSTTFRAVVPWLIGVGTGLFAVSPYVTRALAEVDRDHPARRRALYVGIFLIAIYGGYFGAGIGILLLAMLALALPLEIPELQGLRNVISLVINAFAALVFVFHGHLDVPYVVMLLLGTLVGGWLGALLVVRLSPMFVRVLVIVVGVGTTIKLAVG